MTRESFDLSKDEAGILKPSSPPPSPQNPSLPSQPAPPPPSCLLLNPPLDVSAHSSDGPEQVARASSPPEVEKGSHPPPLFGSRCSICAKKVGLTGFRCRCGDLFCARHRYSDTHDCPFDYKAAGREEISRANPVVRAAKIVKI